MVVGTQAPLCRALVGVGTGGFSIASRRANTQRVSWIAPAIVIRQYIVVTSTIAFFARVEVGPAPAACVEIAHDTPPFSHGAGFTVMGEMPASSIADMASSGVIPVTWHRSSTLKSSCR